MGTKSLNGKVFTKVHVFGRNFTVFMNNFRKFCFLNNSFLEFMFIIIYTLEQACLIFITFYYKHNVERLTFLVSFFALFVLSTFSVHKLVMQSRIKYLENQIQDYIKQNEEIVQKSEFMAKTHIETIEFLKKMIINGNELENNNSEDLNNRKDNKHIKRCNHD